MKTTVLQAAMLSTVVSISACSKVSDSNPQAQFDDAKAIMIQELSGSQNLRLFQPQFTESLDGVAFYPPFNVISEDNEFILSM